MSAFGGDTMSFAPCAGKAFKPAGERGAGRGVEKEAGRARFSPESRGPLEACAIPGTGGATGRTPALPASSVQCALNLAPFSAPRNGGAERLQLPNLPAPPPPMPFYPGGGGGRDFFPFVKFQREREGGTTFGGFDFFQTFPSRALPFGGLNASPAHRAKLKGEREAQ